MRARLALAMLLALATSACRAKPLPPAEACMYACDHLTVCLGLPDPGDGGPPPAGFSDCIALCTSRTMHYAAMSMECETRFAASMTCTGDPGTPCSTALASVVHPGDHCYAEAKSLYDLCGPLPP